MRSSSGLDFNCLSGYIVLYIVVNWGSASLETEAALFCLLHNWDFGSRKVAEYTLVGEDTAFNLLHCTLSISRFNPDYSFHSLIA